MNRLPPWRCESTHLPEKRRSSGKGWSRGGGGTPPFPRPNAVLVDRGVEAARRAHRSVPSDPCTTVKMDEAGGLASRGPRPWGSRASRSRPPGGWSFLDGRFTRPAAAATRPEDGTAPLGAHPVRPPVARASGASGRGGAVVAGQAKEGGELRTPFRLPSRSAEGPGHAPASRVPRGRAQGGTAGGTAGGRKASPGDRGWGDAPGPPRHPFDRPFAASRAAPGGR